MDLISHFCSGFCLGSILSPFHRNATNISTLTYPVLIASGAILPDIDGCSVFFNHKVYYSSFWYSHHGALHSVLGILPLSLLLALLIAIGIKNRSKSSVFRAMLPIFAFLYLGNILHILGDLPCPPGPWWGIMILWPLSTYRFGGWSHIWWFNEYLIVITLAGMLVSLVILEVRRKWSYTQSKPLDVILILANLFILFLSLRFIIISRYVDTIQWQYYQKTLLGDSLYSFVNSWNKFIQVIWVREIL